jgi:hypothetical protein
MAGWLRAWLPKGLLLAVAVYVGLRAAALYFAFDQVAMTNYELYPMGTLPKALLLGADMPLRMYYDNAAGQLLTGLAAVPLYLCFGEGWLSLKLVPALCGLGALLCVWALLDRHASRRAANLGALAFALGPAELVFKYSLMASGNHFENLFFTSLALWGAYRLHVAPPESRRRWLWISGATMGFALFVFLGAIVPVGILLAMHLGVRGWRGSLADLRDCGPGFLVGLSPLVVLNVMSGGRGASFLSAKFGGQGDGRDWGLVIDRIQDFVLTEFPRAGFHYSFEWGSVRVPNLVLVTAFSLAWLAVLPAAIRGTLLVARAVFGGARVPFGATLVLPLALFPPLAALAFGISDLRIDSNWPQRLAIAGYRYFLPIFLFGTMLVAVVSDRWMGAGGVRRLAGVLLAGATLGTGAWNLAWLSQGTSGVGAHYRGWNFMQAARGLFNESLGLSHQRRVEMAESLPAFYRGQLYRGIGFTEAQLWIIQTGRKRGVGDEVVLSTVPMPIGGLVERYPAHARLDIARGAGAGLRTYIGTRGQNDRNLGLLAEGLRVTVEAGDPWAWSVVEGAAGIQDYPFPWSDVPRVLGRSRRLMELLPEGLRATYGRGLGEVCGRLLARAIPAEEEFLKGYLHRVFASGGEALLQGVGRGLAIEMEQPELTDGVRAAVPDARLLGVVEASMKRALAER